VTRLALVVAAVGLMAWQVRESGTNPQGYWKYLEDPPRWDGAPAVVSIYEVAEIRGNRLTIARGRSVAAIEADTAGLSLGDEVTVIGRFRASDLSIVADRVEVHRGRPWKKASGYAAILFVLGLIPLWVRRGRGGLVLRG
jgi:hypothetical protein